MDSRMLENHPKQRLLFFVSEEAGEELTRVFIQVVEELSKSRPWVIGPPSMVRAGDQDLDKLARSDTSFETTAGSLEIYSALPPQKLPHEIDLQHLEEVSALIEILRAFSQQHNTVVEFELDGTFVGSVKNGKLDRMLAEGLLSEWRRELAIRMNDRSEASGPPKKDVR